MSWECSADTEQAKSLLLQESLMNLPQRGARGLRDCTEHPSDGPNLMSDRIRLQNAQPKARSAAQKKRAARIKRRKTEKAVPQTSDTENVSPNDGGRSLVTIEAGVVKTEESAYNIESVDIDDKTEDPLYLEFTKAFQRFDCAAVGAPSKVPPRTDLYVSDEEDTMREDNPASTLSKNSLRKLNRPSVGYLKQLVDDPELVTLHETRATDPHLTLHLKGYRNFVPVPCHWVNPKSYLARKRGIAKPPYELPEYFLSAGISDLRTPTNHSPGTLRSQMRKRVNPQMGTFDTDYQKLHDAFFRYQTKPPLSGPGEVYFEGKEHLTSLLYKRPGELSDELKDALNMPPGVPPPWLLFMQKVGPPPAYPGLKIPGVNAPIPTGAKWGYHPGGWGRPPTDEVGRPLFGDVFGVLESVSDVQVASVERELWGQIEENEEEDEEDEETEEDEEEMKMEDTWTDSIESQDLESGSALTAIPIPEHLDLRKSRLDVQVQVESQKRGTCTKY